MENYLGFHLDLNGVDINYTKLRCIVIKDSKHILLFILNLYTHFSLTPSLALLSLLFNPLTPKTD